MNNLESANNNFQAPLSPTMEGAWETPSPSSPYGGRLVKQISCFYAWYMAWDRTPSAHAEHFRFLSQITRIASVCMQGGAYLTDTEEKLALQSLNDLKSGLYDGTVQQHEIPDYLQRIISDLTFVNHKARLVSHATELEYRLCIHPPENQSPETTEHFRSQLNRIIGLVSPMLEDRDAQAMDQDIAQILKHYPSVPDVQQAISRTLFIDY